MKSISLLLNTTESVKSFVNVISQYDFDMDLRCGRYVVDAKSILGIFSLDLNRPVVLEIHSDSDCSELIQKISQYIYQ
ncbi:MAG: HPr family phosphocarrier protein [Clostridia bacterium]|jgi:phosphocarrier protein HPr|nr:HPr family phosphocarrier protein [Clostridia bacterium]MCI8945002.1 HPr family phosphocarrier protein [Clostridia bacterium]MDE6884726.1 HPr family phosphocarrier protein [Clostridia bacterium]